MSFETGGNNYKGNDNKITMAERYDLPENIYLPEETEITGKLVKQLIDNHIENNVPRYQQLQRYYEGWAAILNRSKESHKANNQLVAAYPSYIVDIFLGMFLGNPVTYTVAEDDQAVMDETQAIFDLNDEQDENTELAKIAGIKGRGYEVVYQDEESKTRFDELEPDNVIYVYDDRINPEPLFAIYFHEVLNVEDIFEKDRDIKATVYTRNNIIEFNSGDDGYVEGETTDHPFDRVPVVEFLNNDEGIGDFERVLPLIDAYNKSISDTANDFEEFTDAILILMGMLNTDDDDIQQLMEDRAILLEDGQGAEWLIKEINDAALENYNKRIDNDIHKFAMVPNLADEQFAGNVSGESMKYKLLALDQIITSKQRKFKTSLQYRLQLILDVQAIRGESFDYRAIEIAFNDNKPINEKDNVDMVKSLMGIVSEQTALGRLHGLESVNDELDRIKQEKEVYMTVDEFMDEDEEDDTDEEDR